MRRSIGRHRPRAWSPDLLLATSLAVIGTIVLAVFTLYGDAMGLPDGPEAIGGLLMALLGLGAAGILFLLLADR